MDKQQRQRALRRWAMGLGLAGLTALAMPALAATPQVDDATAWPPPMTVGARQPLARTGPRLAWCDFAAYNKSKSSLKMAQDPVYRQAPPEVKSAYEAVRKALLAAKPGSPALAKAEAQLAALLRTPDGPTVARLALLDTDPKMAMPALRQARALAAIEPRIISFALRHLKGEDPAVVVAAAALLFAAGCDSPLDYAMDAMEHRDVAVQTGILQLVYHAGIDRQASPAVTRVAEWLDGGAGTTASRVLAVRILGVLVWAPGGATLERLMKDADPAVSGEALAAYAAVGGELPANTVKAFLADPSPLRRAGAIRAIAQAQAMQPDRVRAQVQPLVDDKAPVVDPAAPGRKKPPTVGDLARAALDYSAIR